MLLLRSWGLGCCFLVICEAAELGLRTIYWKKVYSKCECVSVCVGCSLCARGVCSTKSADRTFESDPTNSFSSKRESQWIKPLYLSSLTLIHEQRMEFTTLMQNSCYFSHSFSTQLTPFRNVYLQAPKIKLFPLHRNSHFLFLSFSWKILNNR